MELKEFITKTLNAVVEGVRDAQVLDGGDAINAAGWTAETAGVHSGNYGTFTEVAFDIGVTVTTEGKAKGGIKAGIVSVDAGGGKVACIRTASLSPSHCDCPMAIRPQTRKPQHTLRK